MALSGTVVGWGGRAEQNDVEHIMDLQCGKHRQMAEGGSMDTHTHARMSVEKKSLRRLMYTAAHSPKSRVSVHLALTAKLSHLTSLPSTAGLQQEVAGSHTMTTNIIVMEITQLVTS